MTIPEVKISDASVRRSGNGAERSVQAADAPAEEINGDVSGFRVAVVMMPFADAFRPSIRMGLTKAIGRRAGFHVDDYYLNLDLAAQIGFAEYESIQYASCMGWAGEWLWSLAAFGSDSNSGDFFAAFPSDAAQIAAGSGKDVPYLKDLRDRVIPEFLEACLGRVDWGSYGAVVLFATGEQLVPQLALARCIKERWPQTATIFNCADMDGEMAMEYMRTFPCADYMLTEEIDLSLPELLRRLAEGRETDDMLGVAARRGDGVSFIGPAPLLQDLDSLPLPDYDTYYEAVKRYGLDDFKSCQGVPDWRYSIGAIPIEGSRGCWWGEKSRCNFCGFLATKQPYRRKTPERMLAEIDELSARYGRRDFTAMQLILDTRQIKGIFEPLGERDESYRFFSCLKTNLSRNQVRAISKGGLRYAMPGIENLNTHILKLMRKGVTRLQNVNLMRWCDYYHINLAWCLLYGFPGELPEDYADQLTTIRLITHTQPPLDYLRIRLDRYSCYFQTDGLFPTAWRKPAAPYDYLFPAYVDKEATAYFFDYEPGDGILPDEAHTETRAAVMSWQDAWYSGRRPTLTYRRSGSDITIQDTRFGNSNPRSYTLPEPDADIYEAFSSDPRTPAQACATLASVCSSDLDVDTVTATCDGLCDAGLMIFEAGKYLSLAIPADPEF
jgi:ribosomal peptide maturation radical SAM protein 1